MKIVLIVEIGFTETLLQGDVTGVIRHVQNAQAKQYQVARNVNLLTSWTNHIKLVF